MTVQGVQGVCRVLCRVETRAAIGVCRVCRVRPYAGRRARELSPAACSHTHARTYAPLHTLHTLHNAGGARVAAVQGSARPPAHPAQAHARSRAGAFLHFPIALKGGRGGQP